MKIILTEETEEECVLVVPNMTRRRLHGAAGTLHRASDALTRFPTLCVERIK